MKIITNKNSGENGKGRDLPLDLFVFGCPPKESDRRAPWEDQRSGFGPEMFLEWSGVGPARFQT